MPCPYMKKAYRFEASLFRSASVSPLFLNQ